MKAYKWLSPGRVGLFSDFTWPPPGEWVVTEPGVVDCLVGVHALRFEQLLDWIDDELWEVELAGSIIERDAMLVAERGRLVRRVEQWDEAAARSFSEACASRSAGFAGQALRRAGLPEEADRLEQAEELPAMQHAATAALEEANDARVSEALAFAADLVSLVGGSRPDAWSETAATASTVTQSAGAVAANAAFVAAHVAGRAAVAAASDEASYGPGFASERTWQLAWLEGVLRPG